MLEFNKKILFFVKKTPLATTNSLFHNLSSHSFTYFLHVSALLSPHLQGADTINFLQSYSNNARTNQHTYVCCGIDSAEFYMLWLK